MGFPDVSDGGMLQYLRTERILPRFQTRGFKLIELVRISTRLGRPLAATPKGTLALSRKISDT